MSYGSGFIQRQPAPGVPVDQPAVYPSTWTPEASEYFQTSTSPPLPQRSHEAPQTDIQVDESGSCIDQPAPRAEQQPVIDKKFLKKMRTFKSQFEAWYAAGMPHGHFPISTPVPPIGAMPSAPQGQQTWATSLDQQAQQTDSQPYAPPNQQTVAQPREPRDQLQWAAVSAQLAPQQTDQQPPVTPPEMQWDAARADPAHQQEVPPLAPPDQLPWAAPLTESAALQTEGPSPTSSGHLPWVPSPAGPLRDSPPVPPTADSWGSLSPISQTDQQPAPQPQQASSTPPHQSVSAGARSHPADQRLAFPVRVPRSRKPSGPIKLHRYHSQASARDPTRPNVPVQLVFRMEPELLVVRAKLE